MHQKQFVTVSVFLQHQRRALMLQRANNNRFLPNYWEQAGGKVEYGEHPYEAAVREAKEETSLTIVILHPYYINYYRMPDDRDMIEIAVQGTIVGQQHIALSLAHQSFRWISPGELSSLSPLSDGMRKVIEEGFRNCE